MSKITITGDTPEIVAWLSWSPNYKATDTRQTHFTEKEARDRIQFLSPFLDAVADSPAEAVPLVTMEDHQRIIRSLTERPDTVHSLLDERDMHWLRRFKECCEDPDADGHDLPKSAVRDLQLVGALRNVGFGRSEITKFGEYLLAGGDKP